MGVGRSGHGRGVGGGGLAALECWVVGALCSYPTRAEAPHVPMSGRSLIQWPWASRPPQGFSPKRLPPRGSLLGVPS